MPEKLRVIFGDRLPAQFMTAIDAKINNKKGRLNSRPLNHVVLACELDGDDFAFALFN